jgi:two-component system sporulation sensor kinase A
MKRREEEKYRVLGQPAIKGFIQLAKEGFTKVDIFTILDSEINRIETISSELLVLGKPVFREKE